jgi:hypothetical protein
MLSRPSERKMKESVMSPQLVGKEVTVEKIKDVNKNGYEVLKEK